ncbi:hypothetical protein [Marinobacterium aestuariivivens]|uniref:Molybdopterin oxidoreductase domain-containing protein n=1 Tax=Marinobacterium aestuariivivens TaxID=1698799 RepID=A0ABW1ZYR1_9GAMM
MPAPRGRELEPQQQAWVEAAAQMLRAARQPLLVAGCGLADPRQLRAAAAIAAALQGDESSPKLYLAAAESNSLGLAALCSRGLDDLLQALDDAQKQGRTTTLVVLENDLQRRLAPQAMRELRRRCDRWLVLDGLETPTTQLADAAVAVPTQFEQQGTLVNAAGMLQRAEAVMSAQSASPWRQFADAVRRSRYKADDPGIEAWSWLAQWHNADQLRADLAAVAPVFGEIVVTGPEAGFRIQGRRLARQGPRYGGRTAIRAGVEVRETTPPEDPDSPWNFSMEGSEGIGEWRAAVWAPGWNSVQALGKFQRELGGDWRDSRPRSWLNFLWLQPREVVDRDAVAVSGSWQLIPRFEVFAGEALSDCAGAIRERAGAAVLGIDSAGASRLGLGSWDSLELHYAGEVQTLHVRVDPSLPPSSLAIPQRAGLWCAAADPSPELALKPAVEPLPRPPQLIATDREAWDG